MNRTTALIGAVLLAATAFDVESARAGTGDSVRPVALRFDRDDAAEVPDFQRHVLPLMGRVGCNTRSCHGSFQGQGGFRLSLFGYDFKADRETLMKEGSGRVDLDDPDSSKILSKPTLAVPHKGGKRLEPGTWQYRLLSRWIEGGAKGVETPSHFERLEVVPGEVTFAGSGAKVPLKVVAHWADGGTEDVTCLTRFRSNDESIAEVDADGVVRAVGPGDTHVVAFYDNGIAAIPVIQPVSPLHGDKYPALASRTKVDELVATKLRKLGVVPSPVCTDEEFLRRVGLDLTGTLPTPAEVESFLSDPTPTAEKRSRKVDELLARPTYVAWWTTKLCDYTGDSARTLQPLQLGQLAPKHWYEWIEKRVADNMPYDQLVAGLVLATSREKGQNYDDYVKQMAGYHKTGNPDSYADRETLPYFWARQNFRKPEERVVGFSYAFLGVRLECAQCHKHPFDQWTQDDFNRFGAFFDKVAFGISPESRDSFRKLNEATGLDKLQGMERNKKLYALRASGDLAPWQEVFVAKNGRVPGVKKPAAGASKPAGRVVSAKVLGGDEVALEGVADPRGPLMDWLRSKDNPYFAKAFVNRVWANDFGVGIVNPTDDMNLANPPGNAELLAYLADGFVDHHFDMKWLHREILNSDAYQRSWQANDTNVRDERNFSHAIIRRLPAEVLIDAVAQATGNAKILAAAATDVEPRAIGPRAGYGRGRQNNNYAAKVFGASTRETNCDCNRSDEPNLLQSIYLQNDNELLASIDRPDGWLAEKTGTKGSTNPNPIPAPDLEGVPMDELERRLQDARDKNQAARIKRLEGRIAYVRANPDGARAAAKGPATSKPKLDPAEAESIVREAYLRTFGRKPNPTEARDAGDHLANAPDPARGLRDLLWALLNTKEFATNH